MQRTGHTCLALSRFPELVKWCVASCSPPTGTPYLRTPRPEPRRAASLRSACLCHVSLHHFAHILCFPCYHVECRRPSPPPAPAPTTGVSTTRTARSGTLPRQTSRRMAWAVQATLSSASTASTWRRRLSARASSAQGTLGPACRFSSRPPPPPSCTLARDTAAVSSCAGSGPKLCKRAPSSTPTSSTGPASRSQSRRATATAR